MLSSPGAAASEAEPLPDPMGMLVDTTECIGCRKCEWACNEAQRLTHKPIQEFEDMSVFDRTRRMTSDAFTVVNRYDNPANPEKPVHVKIQCMHCLEPACVSACLVRALQRADNGAVVYDAYKCIGCRYCMLACPFEVPAYEYHVPLTPRVMKCNFCFDRVAKEGRLPACAEMCPPMSLTFGKRSELLTLAHAKMETHPGRYVPRVYGEQEVGGTGWLYLASRPFEELGFLKLESEPVPQLTETIQHSVFKYGLPPLLLYGLLGAAMKVFKAPEGAP